MLMLGYVMLRAKEDIKTKDREGVYIYKKGQLYVARFEYSDVKIYDERDNACRFGYYHNCFRLTPHCSNYFEVLKQSEVVNGKAFYKIRQYLRKQVI